MKNRYNAEDLHAEPEDYEALIRAVARYLNEKGEDDADIEVICAILGIKRSVL